MTKEKYLEVCGYVRELIKGTEFENHVFAVGGCVRDEVMGKDPKDIDMVLDLPQGGINFAKWLEKNQYSKGSVVIYPTYGTAMLHLQAFPDVELEFVHTRKEQYKNAASRNPDTEYGTLEEDAMRRDLTINALYHNLSTDEHVDPTGKGIADIANHRIRVTSNPDIVYSDDPLRILRTIRFASRYGWEIDKETYDGMVSYVDRLSIITQERIRDEFNKMLLCKNPVRAINLIRGIGAMKYVLAELIETFNMGQNKYHFGTVYDHTMAVLQYTSDNDDEGILVLRLAALLHDIGKIKTRTVDDNGNVHFIKHDLVSAKMSDEILKRMKYSNDIVENVHFLVLNHMRTKQWGDECQKMKDKSLRKFQYECRSYEKFALLMKLIDADNNCHSVEHCMPNQTKTIINVTLKMIENGEAMFGYRLPVNGRDIMDYKGIPSGDVVGKYLEYLLKLAFHNPKITKDECLSKIRNYNIE